MKGGSNMKELSIYVRTIVVGVVVIGMCFAIMQHNHNQDLYRLTQASKIVDQKHQQAILENQQEIKFLRMSIGYYE